jgi:hypothetical protein
MDTSQKLLPMLSIGARMPEVREVQIKLAEQGLYTGKVDGWFGPITRSAVLEAQQLANVVEDGIIGPETALVLGFPWKFELPKLERTRFKQLVASNTWSLGKQDSSYEKLTCVGYQPQLDRLVAVVELRKPNGYGGSACSGGSREYVRFFVDWNDDGTWMDVGWVDFTAHNGPFTRPRRVSVSLTLGAKRPPCSSPSLPKIRAILAWDDLPSGPDFVPHWGNVVDVRVQIAPRATFKLPPELLELADKFQMLEPAAFLPKPMSLIEVGKLYAAKPAAKLAAVSPARYAVKALAKLTKSSTTEIAKLAPQIQEITGVSVLHALAELAKLGDGNTSYEELGCIGYDQANRTLNGVITVKLPQGYSGDSCSAGSMEYVGFWLWDAGTWVHLGTAGTRVYDIAKLPDGGLRYAVSLPCNLAAWQRACAEGPVTLRIRAILSWNIDPTSDGPNHTPVWGNREEAYIELAPALAATEPGVFMSNVGGVGVCSIDANGYFDPPNMPDYNAPFGGVVSICGYYSEPPTTTSAAKPKYRISVRHDTDPLDAWQVLNNTFGVTLDTYSSGGGNYQTTMTQVATDGWYTYQEVIGFGATPSVQVQGDVLGYWYPTKEGRHWVKIESMGADGNPVPAIVTHCTDGSTRTIIPIFIDNTGPVVELEITHAMRGATKIERGTCGKFQPGDVLHGTYAATDAYFASCGLVRRPNTAPTPPVPVPPVPVLNGVTVFDPTFDPSGTREGEDNGTWSFDTTGLPPCGYSLTLHAWDRARVNSSSSGHYNETSVGFCLTATGD